MFSIRVAFDTRIVWPLKEETQTILYHPSSCSMLFESSNRWKYCDSLSSQMVRSYWVIPNTSSEFANYHLKGSSNFQTHSHLVIWEGSPDYKLITVPAGLSWRRLTIKSSWSVGESALSRYEIVIYICLWDIAWICLRDIACKYVWDYLWQIVNQGENASPPIGDLLGWCIGCAPPNWGPVGLMHWMCTPQLGICWVGALDVHPPISDLLGRFIRCANCISKKGRKNTRMLSTRTGCFSH